MRHILAKTSAVMCPLFGLVRSPLLPRSRRGRIIIGIVGGRACFKSGVAPAEARQRASGGRRRKTEGVSLSTTTGKRNYEHSSNKLNQPSKLEQHLKVQTLLVATRTYSVRATSRKTTTPSEAVTLLYDNTKKIFTTGNNFDWSNLQKDSQACCL